MAKVVGPRQFWSIIIAKNLSASFQYFCVKTASLWFAFVPLWQAPELVSIKMQQV